MIIKTTNLTKTFRTSDIETIAVNNICLEIEKGEFVAIMGPSGCGKTTLLNILGLLDSPTSGSFMLNGTDVGTLGERDRQIILLRFGIGGAREATQKEVADLLGISQSYISRLEKRIIAHLRQEMLKQMQC